MGKVESYIAICFKCKVEQISWNIIDNWCIHNDELYCRKCQKDLKIGWYEEK